MAITKEQWAEIEEQLIRLMGRVELLCDGYKIEAQVEKLKMKLVVSIYVDGCIKGAWFLNEEGSEIPLKFYREQKRPICSTTLRANYVRMSKSKLWSKEERAEFAAKAKETMSCWWPYWTNAAAFCRHIRKTCTSIELVKIGY